MIYGDSPLKINEGQDALGLNIYTLVPDIYAIRQSSNLYVYCGSNPVMFVDPSGEAWWHWAIGAAIVAVAAVATVVTAGGALPAVVAVIAVGNGVAAATAGATIAASAFIGAFFAFGTSAFIAAINSNSLQDFANQGSWSVVISTAVGAGLGALSGYILDKSSFNKQLKFDSQKLQHEYKHASDYGVNGNWNKANGASFEQAIRNQINSVKNPILGTYRGTQQVYHFYDPKTGLNTMIDMDGNFVGGWMLSAEQIFNLLTTGNVQ